MSDEMTPREHDDMRDLLLAGAQRIRPTGPHRRLASVAVAVLIVAAVTGGVAAIVNGRGAPDEVPAVAPTDSSPQLWPAPDPLTSPSATPPPEWCEPSDFPQASLPGRALPTPGEQVTLERDPCLTAKSLLGWYMWLEDQGIDAGLIQGFQSVAGLEPWIAPLADGSGRCIIMGSADGSSGAVACDSTSGPAAMERTVGGTVLRFVIQNDAIAVSATSR